MNEEEEEKKALLSNILLILWYFLYLYRHCYKKIAIFVSRERLKCK